MTEVSNLSASTGSQFTAPTNGPNIGGEFNTFIQLLTAQVRNQDPLSPLDSTQFVEQLATFSTLEQQVQSNSNLAAISNTIEALYALTANEWLGSSVTVESSWVPYSGDEISFQIDTAENIDRSELRILDNSGNLIWQDEIDPNTSTHSWNGQTLSGETVQNQGLYQFHIDQFNGTEYVGTTAPRIVTVVTDVAAEGGKLRLGTSSYLNAMLEDVRRLEP